MPMKTKKKLKASKTESKDNSILSRIRPVGDINLTVKALLYGRSGTGKTHMIGTFPKKVLILDVREDGTDTVRKQIGVDRFDITCWSDLEEIYWFLKTGDHDYKTIAIDTLTSLQPLAIRHIAGPDGHVSKQGWGKVAGLMGTWIFNFKELPMHVIFTAQDKLSASGSDEDDLDVDTDGQLLPEMGPAMIPSVVKMVNATVKTIGNTFIRERVKVVKTTHGKKEKREVVYSMRIGPHARYITKVRSDNSGTDYTTPSLIDDPSYAKLITVIKGGSD